MEIVFQKEITKLGNDCVIHRLYLIFEWLGKYVVKGYMKVNGWCDHGIEDLYFDKDTFCDFEDAKRAINRAMRNNFDSDDRDW